MRHQPDTVIHLRGVSSPRDFFLLRGCGAYILVGGLVFLVAVVAPDLDTLGEPATWVEPATWLVAAAALVLGLLALFVVQRMIRRAPRQFARYECAVSSEGIELVRHRKLWARGERALIHWSNIHAITTETMVLPRDKPQTPAQVLGGVRTRKELVGHRIITILLYEAVSGVPDFRHYEPNSSISGVDHPVHAVDLRGNHSLVEPTNRDLWAVAEAIERQHPGLFRRGIRTYEWFPQHPSADSPHPN